MLRNIFGTQFQMLGDFLDFSEFGHFWTFMRPKTGTFQHEIFFKRTSKHMNRKLQILKKTLLQSIFKSVFHEIFKLGCDILKSQICVEPQNLPVGPAKTNERGECCAPLTFMQTLFFVRRNIHDERQRDVQHTILNKQQKN